MTEHAGYRRRRQHSGTNPWGVAGPHDEDVTAFERMVEQLRAAQALVTGASPPESVLAEVTGHLEKISAALAPYQVPEREQLTGHLTELPGRGQALAPVFHADEYSRDHVRGRVTFDRYYLGGNGAVHGGTIPLLFDEVLGRLANADGRPVSRTAYLNVDFRKITPVGRELRVSAWFDREEGRKRFLRGTIHDGDALTAEAHGLFIALRPGQP